MLWHSGCVVNMFTDKQKKSFYFPSNVIVVKGSVCMAFCPFLSVCRTDLRGRIQSRGVVISAIQHALILLLDAQTTLDEGEALWVNDPLIPAKIWSKYKSKGQKTPKSTELCHFMKSFKYQSKVSFSSQLTKIDYIFISIEKIIITIAVSISLFVDIRWL